MANEGLWQQLLELDGQETARRAKCRYLSNPERYIITLLNSEYVVNLSEKQVSLAEHSSAAGFTEELCILTYLINSQDLLVADKLTTVQGLPDGQFFFRGPHKLPSEKLEEVFGQYPERLYEVADKFSAKRCIFGDVSVEFYVLPRIPLTIVIWRGDEEFGARASILFDETAAAQLPLDALWAAANLAIKALVKATTESG